MRSPFSCFLLFSIHLAFLSSPAHAQRPSIAEFTRTFEHHDGFIPMYWDASEGKLWLEVPRMEEEFLYAYSLPAGIGSNDIGLDRGQIGGQMVVFFRRVGPRVLLVQPNYAYRATTDDPAERQAVEDAFAQSVIWGFEVAAETGDRVLVDATEFALRDVHGVVAALERAGQGRYALDRSRSALHLARTKAFPRNTEIEATLTFTSNEPGAWVSEVTPSPESVTVRERHSLIALPEPGFEVRRAHPGAGSALFFQTSYADYAAPIGESILRRYVARHRLQKRDPSAAVSEPVAPIVYYVDPGVPEPIRSALVDGAAWWNDAFEAAGYRDAFRVEILPADADPMDVRYNFIQWVHRATRGWSYGGGIIDPRTGEIIKGHVTLGSLRVRQDYLLAEGLISPYESGDERPPELAEMALARIRQLSAHEVGHTLGLAHNYIASAQGPNGRASVMDYPHPLARLRSDGTIDLSDAYDHGIGAWDEVAIRYLYEEFPEGTDEEAALEAILREARAEGLTFLTDADARPPGSVHPAAHLWDGGRNATDELRRVMGVRRAALERFGLASVPAGAPLATIEEVFVPLYLHHRYQIEAAVKALAGQYYTIALRGDGQEPLRAVPRAEQMEALDALLETLSPAELAIPAQVLALIPPRPPGYPPHRELFDRHTGLAFDPVTPAASLAEHTLGLLLHTERATRLVTQQAIDPQLPGLTDVLDRVFAAAFETPARPTDAAGYHAELRRTVQRVVLDRALQLAASAPAPQVRALTEHAVKGLKEHLATLPSRLDTQTRAHTESLVREIDRYFESPSSFARRMPPPAMPPGSPIGN